MSGPDKPSALYNSSREDSVSNEEFHPFVEQLLPYIKEFSFVWFNLQAAKRKFIKRYNRRMNIEEEKRTKDQFAVGSITLIQSLITFCSPLLQRRSKSGQADF
jgi:hypothetical protein